MTQASGLIGVRRRPGVLVLQVGCWAIWGLENCQRAGADFLRISVHGRKVGWAQRKNVVWLKVPHAACQGKVPHRTHPRGC